MMKVEIVTIFLSGLMIVGIVDYEASQRNAKDKQCRELTAEYLRRHACDTVSVNSGQ